MLRDTILLAFREIRRNVMRSSLTILGIVIGVGAVIIMVTIGRGATAQVTAEISELGSNLLILRPGQRRGHGGSAAGAKPFEMGDVEAIAREIASVSAVTASSSRVMTSIFGNQNWSTGITGTDNEFFKVRNWAISRGRRFSESELRSGISVCILGATVLGELFGGQNPLGSRIRLGQLSCQVIGILDAKGQSSFGQNQDDLILIPLRTFQRRIADNQDVGMIQVSVQEGVSTEKVRRNIVLLIRERRLVLPGEEDDFSVLDMKEISSMLAGITQTLTALLGAVAAVSLLVGGISIMNIMLVSVTERTREIGIRLAIGALEREVLFQFLVEAVVLSSIGGILGILVALTASAALVDALEVPFVLEPGIIVIAFLFSAAVGVIFGYFPARRAARLDPIDALRHE